MKHFFLKTRGLHMPSAKHKYSHMNEVISLAGHTIGADIEHNLWEFLDDQWIKLIPDKINGHRLLLVPVIVGS